MTSTVRTSIVIVLILALAGTLVWALLRSADQETTSNADDENSEYVWHPTSDGLASVDSLQIQLGDQWSGVEQHLEDSVFVREYTENLGMEEGSVVEVWRLTESADGAIGGVQEAVIVLENDSHIEALVDVTNTETSGEIPTDVEYTMNNIGWVFSGHLACFSLSDHAACVDPSWYGVDVSDRAALEQLLSRFSQ